MRPESWEEFRAEAEAARELWEYDEGERDDHLDLLEHLEAMAADPLAGDIEKCYRDVVEDSYRLVAEHWAEVETLASALENSGTLSGEAAVEIIEMTAREKA
jgi:hypothetical protein